MLAMAGMLLLLSANTGPAPRMVAAGKAFSFPVPAGYADVSTKYPESGFAVLEARAGGRGLPPTIVFRPTPVAGGSAGDAAVCEKTGASTATKVHGKLRSASIVGTPLGKACQMDMVVAGRVALITELNVVDPQGAPRETWLMTCNHADGDGNAERVCRQTLGAIAAADNGKRCFSLAYGMNSEGTNVIFRRRGLQGGGPTWAAIMTHVVKGHVKVLRRATSYTPDMPGFGMPLIVAYGKAETWYILDAEGDGAVFCAGDEALFKAVRADYTRLNGSGKALEEALARIPAEEVE